MIDTLVSAGANQATGRCVKMDAAPRPGARRGAAGGDGEGRAPPELYARAAGLRVWNLSISESGGFTARRK